MVDEFRMMTYNADPDDLYGRYYQILDIDGESNSESGVEENHFVFLVDVQSCSILKSNEAPTTVDNVQSGPLNTEGYLEMTADGSQDTYPIPEPFDAKLEVKISLGG